MSRVLAQVADALEAHAGITTSRNATPGGYWERIALSAEELSGTTSAANAGLTGYMLRAATAFEAMSGTSGAEENDNQPGLIKRSVDALETLAGSVGTGSLLSRLETAAATAVFPLAGLFAGGEAGFYGTSLDPAAGNVWQDSARTTPGAVDQSVGSWRLKTSGADIYAAQATADNRPILRQDGNGKYYLSFDGTNDCLTVTFTIAQPWDRISAIRQVTWTANDRFFSGIAVNAGILYQPGAGVSPQIALFDGAAGATNGGLALDTNAVITERHDGANSRLAVNSGAYTTGNPGTTLPGGISIGGASNGAAAAACRVYNVLMIQRALSDAEIARARAYIAAGAAVTL